METILMNTENRKTNKSHIFRLILFGKLDLKNLNKNIVLANISIYYTCQNIISAYNSNKFKISAPTWNDEFDLSDGSYSISDIQEHFLYITKNTRLWQIIHKYKCTLTKSKIVLCLKLKVAINESYCHW